MVRALADHGVGAVTDEALPDEIDSRLTVLPHLIQCEPLLTAEHEDIVERTLSEMEAAWAAGRVAALSTHRRNYKGFDQGDFERNFDCLERPLAAVHTGHREAVYPCGDEVSQLKRQAYSVVRRGRRIICRNYDAASIGVTFDVGGQAHEVSLPRGELIFRLE